MIKENLEKNTNELESLLQKIAGSIASGVLSEKLPPSRLLEKTESHIIQLSELATNSHESMLILKPEKAHTIKAKYKNLTQTLTTFKDILLQNTSDPAANSHIAFEQLKKALTDGSDLLFLMQEVRDNPSPLISHLLDFENSSQTKSSVISIHTSEEIQPTIKYILGHLEELNKELTELENRIGEIKNSVRELQEESSKILPEKTDKPLTPTENKTEKRQLHISNFRPDRN